MSPSGGWPLSNIPWPPWKTPSRMVFRLSWRRRFRSLWSRFLLRGLPLALRSSARAFALLCPRPLPAVLAAPFCSASAVPRGFPSRAVLRPEAPYRPSLALQLLIPPRLPLERPVRGVPQAPPKRGNAGGTSTAVGCDDKPNARCDARLGVKHPRAVRPRHRGADAVVPLVGA